MVEHRIVFILSINGRRGFLTSPNQCVELIQLIFLKSCQISVIIKVLSGLVHENAP